MWITWALYLESLDTMEGFQGVRYWALLSTHTYRCHLQLKLLHSYFIWSYKTKECIFLFSFIQWTFPPIFWLQIRVNESFCGPASGTQYIYFAVHYNKIKEISLPYNILPGTHFIWTFLLHGLVQMFVGSVNHKRLILRESSILMKLLVLLTAATAPTTSKSKIQ